MIEHENNFTQKSGNHKTTDSQNGATGVQHTTHAHAQNGKCGFNESEILSRQAKFQNDQSESLRIHCPNEAGHKNGDKHASAYYYLKTGLFGCNVCGIKGFAIDRNNSNFKQSKRYKQSIEAQSEIDNTRISKALRELDTTKTFEFQIRDLFVNATAGSILFHNENWIHCDSATGLWKINNKQAYKIALRMAEIIVECLDVGDFKTKQKLRNKIEHDYVIRSALKGGSEILSTECENIKFDSIPHLLGVPSGVVELKTGDIRKADAHEYISKTLLINPKSGKHPTFDKLIAQISNNDFGVEMWLLKFLGYCLTGHTKEETNLFITSAPGAGKTTLGEILAYILGQYCVMINSSDVIEQRFQPHPQWMSRTEGARLGIVSELPDNAKWNTKALNKLGSTDSITARDLYKSDRTFENQMKCLIYGNHLPQFPMDDGLGRKLRLLDLKSTIPLNKQDVEMKSKLQSEAPAILHTLLVQTVAWYETPDLKKTVPECMQISMKNYIREQDTVEQFIDTKIKRSNENDPLAKNVYESYVEFCEGDGLRKLTKNTFYKHFEKKGFVSENRKNGKCFIGVEFVEG